MENKRYLQELSKCVRCGNCKAFCPTYDADITETMGARGRLALLWGLSTGELKVSPLLKERIFSCIICGACSELCPLGVDIREVMYHSRHLLRRHDLKSFLLRLFARLSTERPRFGFNFLKTVQSIFPSLLKGFLPSELPEEPLNDGTKVYTTPKKRGRVAIFTGCFVNFFYPYLGNLLIRTLQRLNYEVILPMGEVCCGVPFRTLGFEEDAMKLAKRNVKAFSRLNAEAIVSLCPTCIFAVKVEYPKLIGKGIEKAMDIASFFMNTLDFSCLPHSLASPLHAVYHNPCHLSHGLGVKKEPREIIMNMGINLIDIEEERCCGLGGTFSLFNKPLSQRLLEKCIRSYSKAETDIIITSCPGCLTQLKRGFKNKSIIHLIEVIEGLYRNKDKKFIDRRFYEILH